MREHEQRDVMNVATPCSRPNQPFRLFDIDFHSYETPSSETNATAAAGGIVNGESGRQFECHYCYCNFVTYQGSAATRTPTSVSASKPNLRTTIPPPAVAIADANPNPTAEKDEAEPPIYETE